MENVALEWISTEEVEPCDVVQFVQKLESIPDGDCEVGSIYSRWCRSTGNKDQRRIRNEVQLACESIVAEFLCKKFGKQTIHVTQGEVIHVRCKRVFLGIIKPLAKLSIARSSINSPVEEDIIHTNIIDSGDDDCYSRDAVAVLPIDKVIALIDLLGDQVVDAQEAYEFFADSDARPPQRMTMAGLSKALTELGKSEFVVNKSPVKVTVKSVRHLLSNLMSSSNVAVRKLPTSATKPFLSYTDFLACYVAYLSNLS